MVTVVPLVALVNENSTPSTVIFSKLPSASPSTVSLTATMLSLSLGPVPIVMPLKRSTGVPEVATAVSVYVGVLPVAVSVGASLTAVTLWLSVTVPEVYGDVAPGLLALMVAPVVTVADESINAAVTLGAEPLKLAAGTKRR